MMWERSVSRLWEQHIEFYEWIVDEFLRVEDPYVLVPRSDAPFHIRRRPWIAYEVRAAV